MTVTADLEAFAASNPRVCPIGGDGYVGEYWSTMPNDLLAMALESTSDKLTEAHKNEINVVFKQREPTHLEGNFAMEILAERIRMKRHIRW